MTASALQPLDQLLAAWRELAASQGAIYASGITDLADAIDPVLPALRAALAPTWQPIQTCPVGYDGKTWTRVLFKGVSSGRSFDYPAIVIGWKGSDGRLVHNYSYKLTITHWMPLPAAPPETGR